MLYYFGNFIYLTLGKASLPLVLWTRRLRTLTSSNLLIGIRCIQVACSVKMNDHKLNVISVILRTVGGCPNQVTQPLHMVPVSVR